MGWVGLLSGGLTPPFCFGPIRERRAPPRPAWKSCPVHQGGFTFSHTPEPFHFSFQAFFCCARCSSGRALLVVWATANPLAEVTTLFTGGFFSPPHASYCISYHTFSRPSSFSHSFFIKVLLNFPFVVYNPPPPPILFLSRRGKQWSIKNRSDPVWNPLREGGGGGGSIESVFS